MTAFAYEELVEQLVRVGVPRARAEDQARKELGIIPLSEADMADAIEDVHVEEGDRLMRSLGFEAVHFSQKKRAKVTAGIPDRKYYHRTRRLTAWYEAKMDTGRQRPAQREFQEMAEACGEIYVLGPLEALKTWLVESGVATREGERFEPTAIQVESECVA